MWLPKKGKHSYGHLENKACWPWEPNRIRLLAAFSTAALRHKKEKQHAAKGKDNVCT